MAYALALNFATFPTAAGACAIAWNDTGVAGLLLPSHDPADIRRWRTRRAPEAEVSPPDARVAAVVEAVARYFDGEVVDFSEIPVDLSGQDAFFTRIYQALRQVGYGRTTTYGALARDLGAGPEAARDVGVAMSTNPVPLIIPCHRVLAAGGKIGGFSAPGGSDSKARMLRLEGVEIVEPKPKPDKPAPPPQAAFDF